MTVVATLFAQSCSDENLPTGRPGTDGFFIVNEGTFGSANTSISFYDRETDLITNNLFEAVNGRPLGDQAQSMTVFEGKAYIVVQGSGKIEVIDANEYTSVASITDDIESPRYMLGVSATKGYVSDWGADGLTGTVRVLDLTTNEVTKTIPTGFGPNKMLKVGDLVYVTHVGGFGNDNMVKVIDTNTDEVTASITAGDNPNSIQVDAAGNIWVTSSGIIAFDPFPVIDEANSIKGSISKITDDEEVLRLEVNGFVYGGATNLEISPDGQTLYYIFNGSVYSMPVSATSLPTSPLLEGKYYYGFSVDPFNGNLIGTVAPDFISAGTIEVLDGDGTLLNTYTVGIAPNGIAFK